MQVAPHEEVAAWGAEFEEQNPQTHARRVRAPVEAKAAMTPTIRLVGMASEMVELGTAITPTQAQVWRCFQEACTRYPSATRFTNDRRGAYRPIVETRANTPGVQTAGRACAAARRDRAQPVVD